MFVREPSQTSKQEIPALSSAAFSGCGSCGLSSPQSATGDWKVARTSRLESLLYVHRPRCALLKSQSSGLEQSPAVTGFIVV